MGSISSESRDLLIYYDHEDLEKLALYRRVVLQPSHYTDAQLRELVCTGTEPLAYVSLGEDTGPAALWQRPYRNPDWGGHYVLASHPEWLLHLQVQVSHYLERGFRGLFLDTLDTVDLFPEDRSSLIELVRRLRELSYGHYMLANRGFGLLPELAELVDGFVFEAFSTVWHGEGYRVLPTTELLENVEIAHRLQRTECDLYALDYADTAALEAFARARAQTHGFQSLISNRHLTRL